MASEAPTPSATTNGAQPEYTLDVEKLHSLPSEQQELYLLTFASDLANYTTNLNADQATAYQASIKKEVFQIITLSSPTPTRVIRDSLGRTLSAVFTKGDRKPLFESINDLIATLGTTGKSEKELASRHAAVHCLGAIFEAAGDSAIGTSSLACTITLRQLKAAQHHVGFKASTFKALGKIAKGVGYSLDEHVARDIWKQARSSAAGDKSFQVQIAACWCLEHLIQHTPYFDNSNDYEKLQAALFKALDSQSPTLRTTAASCLSACLVKSYSENPHPDIVPRPKKQKKPTKRQPGDLEDEEDTIDRPGSPAPGKPAMQLSYGFAELLRQLSAPYCRPATSNRTRAGLALCYVSICRRLPIDTIQKHYPILARNLFEDILSNPAIYNNRYRLLISRKFVRIILEKVVGRELLGESAQLDAAKFLLNGIIKDYPQSLKERPEPSKQVLTGALSALAALLGCVRSASNAVAESCREGLFQVLQHPSYTVQVHASACFRSFVSACPQQLLSVVTMCSNSLNRELGLLGGHRQSSRRCVGLANGLAALLSTSTENPLYGSLDVYARVLSQATTLLKSSSSSNLRISSTQIQVAWILLGGLMSLGPNFVKIHITQLLLLWKNALPKPLNRETMHGRDMLELSFLTHVRECALGSILTFLEYNKRLLTADVTKRLATMLQNTSVFVTSLPRKKVTDDAERRLSPSLDLHDFDLMVRRRVFQCYTKLVIDSAPAARETLLQSNLLPLAVSAFADPENYAPNSLSASIASSIGNFESIWEVGDNSGFGITGLLKGYDVRPLPGETLHNGKHHWLTQTEPDGLINQTVQTPVCGALEHDSVLLYLRSDSSEESSNPEPSSTQVVDHAINLFAISLALQGPRVQESILEQITAFLTASLLQRDPARHAAMTVNVVVALLNALKVAAKETVLPPGNIRRDPVEKALQELLQLLIVYHDPYVRNAAAQAFGRMCSAAGTQFTQSQVTWLIDKIVANREPSARAGCALALGCIHSQLGGMAAGFHLKNIVGILMSLSNDPHPTVHFWALESLSKVADSAGLSYSSYVSGTLGILAQLYASDSHNAETNSLGGSNLEVDLPTPAVLARCTDSIINVLGPDLQDMTKARELILTLVRAFGVEQLNIIRIESVRCLEHLSLYAPGHLDFALYVTMLQKELKSESARLRSLAIDGLHNLMRRDADDVINAADPGLGDQLWHALDNDPMNNVLRSIMQNWLHQSALTDPARWIERCNTALLKAVKVEKSSPKPAQKKSVAIDLKDDEVAGFAAAAGAGDEAAAVAPRQEFLRWQVRAFAMDCLIELLSIVARDVAAKEVSPAETALVQEIGDIIKIAFAASTGSVIELRLRGLQTIDMVLKMFGKTPDPDFAEASLLEQYQAQIGSAVTPSFAADSSPELAAQAISVCASFIATGIVTDVDKMGRILKLLVSALENLSKEDEFVTVGDLKGLSSNALVMVKMAVFSAWAELQIASAEQKYLVDVLKPHLAKLAPLWLASLREYAQLRFEPDVSGASGPASMSGSLDTVYAALNRDTLLHFYQSAWLNLVDAIASLIDQDSEFVFDALDEKPEGENSSAVNGRPSNINYRDEPVAFFFVLYGLAFEALIGQTGEDVAAKERTISILQAVRKILRPSVSGQAIYRDDVFSETMDMLGRLVLTEPLNVQHVVVQIARNLCLSHPSARKPTDRAEDDRLSEDIDQLFELTRLIVLTLAGLIPNVSENKHRALHALNEEAVDVVTLALSSLVDAAAVFPIIIRTDLHACILHLFVTILGTGACQATIVPQVLPIFKRFITSLALDPLSDTATQLRGMLVRFFQILKSAQLRESEAALPCERNTLLAFTIFLSSASNLLNPDDPLLARFVSELSDGLENGLTCKVAANCARSILSLSRKNPAEASLVVQLLPRVLGFITMPPDLEGLEEGIAILIQGVIGFVQSLAPDQALSAMSLVISALLARANQGGQESEKEVGTRLLELAATNQRSFRSILGAMDQDQRAFLEQVIRASGISMGKKEERKVDTEPTIALKMDFGA
ncbi:HEAT repeat protein-like protein [Eremomyces bilateralis CBS 781.70]|uniref:HEAT repeat protein-like protein n=1 Tax=Eremomyces bilateralis CBS 781.70 TaxID=1392243 RepID=A0A6G1FX87_9PEZI|nr:HEAT repeat protein-like protein [Eremomyces bilateralis CBS 781.70]KAF1810301.1 HEAT repeat protein-like protein [Eremomyces bilateralis CBS 781.70]